MAVSPVSRGARPVLRASRSDWPLLSVVLPVFNEVRGLPHLIQGLRKVLDELPINYELIFVNDGSTDGSGAWLDAIAAQDDRLAIVHFSRNFGHQSAIQAGMKQVRGDAVVVMDTDLQDDPAAIPLFLEHWRAGYDVVYAIRTQRKESLWKRLLFSGFYLTLRRISDVSLPLDAGNFSLIDRRVADELNEFPERDRFFPGLRSYVGHRQTGVMIERRIRYDDKPRVSLWGLLGLARSAIFGFSRAPFLAFYAAGFLTLGMCFLLLLGWGILETQNVAIPDWGVPIGACLALGSIQLIGTGVLGEYMWRILSEVRQRPAYGIEHIQRRTDFSSPRETTFSLYSENLDPTSALGSHSVGNDFDAPMTASTGVPAAGANH